MDSIHDVLSALNRHPLKKAVLATLIHVEGSSYRKEGASMVIFEDRTYEGVLTAGCLEADVVEHSKALLNQHQAFKLLTYDLRSEDDISWGMGSGCNGKIRIILEPIDRLFQTQLINLSHHLQEGRPVLSIKKISHCDLEVKRVFIPCECHETYGQWSVQPTSNEDLLCKPKPFKGCSCLIKKNKDNSVFQQLHWPQPNFFIIGAGVDAKSLTEMASRVGFTVHIIDWRTALCNKRKFPSASYFHIRSFEDGFQDIKMTALDSVLVMTHKFEKDELALRDLLGKDLFYLGVLGSKRRTARLLHGKKAPAYLDSPAGLDISAEGPDEIAVSILAQVIRRMRVDEDQANEG